jgi:hypothetical protein
MCLGTLVNLTMALFKEINKALYVPPKGLKRESGENPELPRSGIERYERHFRHWITITIWEV